VTLDLHTQGFLDALGRIDARKKKKMTYQILKGNSLDLLPTLADNSIDAIVTDPPYGLGNPDPDYIIKAIQLWASGDRDHIPEGKGFMGKSWDSFVPPPAIWDECLRVLKPGGHLLAFAGTRTYDLMGISIRMAGFEIRDSIGWVYGSGFPKSLDISKAIDKNNGKFKVDFSDFGKYVKESRESKGYSRKQLDQIMGTNTAVSWWEGRAAGVQLPSKEAYNRLKPILEMDNRFDSLIDWAEAEREVIGSKMTGIANKDEKERYTIGASKAIEVDITAPSTPEAKQWQGWGTALKPALEPIVVARKPLGEKTVAENVLTHGTGGLNIDASRIGTEQRTNQPAGNKQDSKGVYKFSNDEVDAFNGTEPTTVQGRWPANLILSHGESCQPTGKTIKSKTGAGKRTATFGTQDTQSGGDGSGGWSGYEYETEVYECVEGCPVKTLDEQSGTTKSSSGSTHPNTSNGYHGNLYGQPEQTHGFGDTGGASRFFYVAKASKRDRNEGLQDLPEIQTTGGGGLTAELREDGSLETASAGGKYGSIKAKQTNFHPTVKPTELMRYLVKLITPPGGTVLDPFTGSGSTGKAAILEGFDFIGIELTEDYWSIIEGRLKHAEAKVAERIKETSDQEQEQLF
jgi:DNA modification methylase